MTSRVLAWRLAKRAYAGLSGEGARRHGGRWNSPGRPLVYMAEHPALALVEVLVHLDLTSNLLPDDYVTMRIDLTVVSGDDNFIETAPSMVLESECRAHGDIWLAENRSLLLRVPSVVVPHSFNLLLNPRHALAARLPEPEVERFALDPRLLW